MIQVGQVSECNEDYLKIIYQLERERRVARIKDIARRKGVRMASVSGALRRMSRMGLLNYGAGEFVELTESGSELARKICQRYDFLSRFLTGPLAVDSDTARQDAESMEHRVSPETLSGLVALHQFLETNGLMLNLSSYLEDGKDMPCRTCPNADHTDEPEVQRLCDLEPGTRAMVEMLEVNGARRLRLVERGILPQVTVYLESRRGEVTTLLVDGSRIELTAAEATAILVHELADQI